MKQRDARRTSMLEQALGDLRARFDGRVLAIDEVVAERWGELSGAARASGGALPVIDALLAATALQHNLVLVTRNERDFRRTGATVLNPFDS